MPKLYNPSRTPLPVTLRDGSATSIPAKGTLEVAEAQMGSGDISRKLKARQLLRRGTTNVVETPVSEATKVEPVKEPEVAETPTVSAKPTVTKPAEKQAEKPVEKPAEKLGEADNFDDKSAKAKANKGSSKP